MQTRRLSLKREVLQELSDSDLGLIAGAGTVTTIEVRQTIYSCLHYISCAFLNTCWAPESLLCLQTD